MRWPRTTLFALLLIACGGDDTPTPEPAPETAADRAVAALPPTATEEDREQARIDAEFPQYAAIVGILATVHQAADGESPIIGWLRIGARVRVANNERRGNGCDGSWRPVHPVGYVCDDNDVEVRDAAIDVEAPTLEGWHDGVQLEDATERGVMILPAPADLEATLPYTYWYVRESTVPEYHRLPSRNEQRAAIAKAERYRELYALDERRARRYLSGEADDGPRGTAVTNRYLDRGFYVASNGIEVRASRRFVRTTQGRFIKQAQLEERHGAEMAGIELNEVTTLPIAWTVRAARPLVLTESEDDSSFSNDEEVEAWERQTRLSGWQERRNIGGDVMHVIETETGTRYLRAWWAVVAERIDRPDGVAEDEPWVHVDLSEQTLVMYRGNTPIYATLVSTGVEEHATPTGLFAIHQKHVTDTMSNIGPEASDDRYSIEDVPWTQYFESSFALHTAFWHTRFGLPRSHGCVNMSPADAHWVFQRTWPEIPEGWHGVNAREGDLPASHVLVTD